MKFSGKLISLFFLFQSFTSYSQDIIDWDSTYILQLSDFQNPATHIGGPQVYTVSTSTGITYYIMMYELQFNRNLNSKIKCTFNRDASFIIAPDTATALYLLSFARFEFDLSELYARKLRKRLNEKRGGFAGPTYLESTYNELYAEMNERRGNAGRLSEVGQHVDKLRTLHIEVLHEMDELADYCRTCKPPKRKKMKE